METIIKASQPLNLEGAFNVRDLGGYVNKNGIELKRQMFLRSDGLQNLTECDCRFLKEYGVRLVIDLRTDMELEREPSKMRDYEEVEYINIPLIDNVQSNGLKGLLPNSLQELYIGLLDNSKDLIKEILGSMVEHKDECVLFNCTAGKDRTGVIAMLLLNLAEVSDEVIIEDYRVTEGNMKSVFHKQKEEMKALGFEVPEFLLKSEKEYMEETLEYFKEKYGSSKRYMSEIGLSHEEIEILENKLIKGV